MTKFTINLIKFKDKYFDAIRNGIKKKYKQLYPNNKITIKYSKNGWDRIYNFHVSVNLKTFSEGGDIINKLTRLGSYTNIEAINIFSDISMEEYLEEYDDSKKDYRKQLIEYVEGIMVTYKLMGVNFKSYNIDNKRYSITIDSQHLLIPIDYSIMGQFQYDILTKMEFENIKAKIIGELQLKIRYINGKPI